jgi:hypothetical protein
MWGRPDNQEVGLEAAILERVRNSSLVKWSCADNVAGLKRTAEAVSLTHDIRVVLRSDVQWCGWVGERPASGEARAEATGGGCGSENAGMSSESRVRTSAAG